MYEQQIQRQDHEVYMRADRSDPKPLKEEVYETPQDKRRRKYENTSTCIQKIDD